jgi:hypothetical protein
MATKQPSIEEFACREPRPGSASGALSTGAEKKAKGRKLVDCTVVHSFRTLMEDDRAQHLPPGERARQPTQLCDRHDGNDKSARGAAAPGDHPAVVRNQSLASTVLDRKDGEFCPSNGELQSS